ncbi:hypothetical protein ACFL5X_01945 [Candidatus Omnitrophota bacterium]
MSIIYDALKKIEGTAYYRPNRRINSKKLILPLVIAVAAMVLLSWPRARTGTALPAGRQAMPAEQKIEVTQAPQSKITLPPARLAKEPRTLMLRDPFSQQSQFKLSGIIYSPEKPMAIINSKTVSIGEIVNQATVAKIDADSVELSLNNKTLVLTLE